MEINKNKRLIEQAKWIVGDNHWNDTGMFNRVYSKWFVSKEDYIEKSIEYHNSRVSSNDIVIFLGDLGRNIETSGIIERLNGIKVLILGNHDSFTKERAIKMGFSEVYDTPTYHNKRLLCSHEPTPVEPGVLNVHGHTHLIKLKSEWHLNMCPEWWGFRPVSIKYILKHYVYSKPKPNRKFMQEWFKDIQISYQENSRERFNLREDGTIESLKEETQLKSTITTST